MSLIDEIKIKSLSDAQEILKAAGSEDIFEKAHKDGDLHPNGKWVWVSSAAGGKGDWRTLNGRTHKKHQSESGGSSTGVSSVSSSSRKVNSSQNNVNIRTDLPKIDMDTIDQDEYNRAYKEAKSANKLGRTMGLSVITSNINKYKKKLEETISNRPGAKATIKKLQGNLTKFISQKKATEDVNNEVDNSKTTSSNTGASSKKEVRVGYGNFHYPIKIKNMTDNSETYSHDINGVSVNVSKNKDGSYTLEANGKKVKSDDPSFFKDKLTPRVKKALAKEVGIDIPTSSKKTTSKKSALPNTMLEINGDMDKEYGDKIRPFTYTSNGVQDLINKDKKGFAIWVGFQHEIRGRQPVNREKMKNFINDTAIPSFLNEIYKRTGKEFKKEDVKIDDYWNSTDMFRIYLLTDKTENGAIKEGESNKTSGSKTSSTISLKSPSKVFKKIPAKNSDELYKKTLSYLGGRISAKTNNGLIEGTIQNSTKKDDRVVLTIKKDDGSLTKISTSILGTSKYQAPQPDASKIKEIKDSKKGVGVKISSAVGATDWSTVNYLINSGMEIQYQHGLSFRRGSNSFKKISAEEALEKMHQNATFDAGVKDGILYINTYSSFDMD